MGNSRVSAARKSEIPDLHESYSQLHQLCREHQCERDHGGWRTFRAISVDLLVGVFEAAERANNPPPISNVEDFINLIVEESFPREKLIGTSLAPLAERLMGEARTAALEILEAARASGLGWRQACARARVAADAVARGGLDKADLPHYEGNERLDCAAQYLHRIDTDLEVWQAGRPRFDGLDECGEFDRLEGDDGYDCY